MQDERPIIELAGVTKSFAHQNVLRGIYLQIAPRSFVVIRGRSGSGKSTLLSIIAGLEPADSGSVSVCGESLDGRSQEGLASLRLRNIGLVFQFFNLLPTLTLKENVAVAGQLAGRSRKQTQAEASEYLHEVGLAAHQDKLPHEVSGGEVQRAAVARALMNSPQLILADEPTGSLDRESSQGVINLFRNLVASRAVTVVLVSHEPEVEQSADRVFHLQDGLI